MKKSKIRFAAAVACVLTALIAAPPLASPASAQSEAPVNIGVLDVQQILRETKAAKAIHAEIEKQRNAYQNELAQQEKALVAADQKLSTQRASLSEDAYRQERQKLDQQAGELRKNVELRKRQLEDSYDGGMDQVRKALLQVVAEIAQARKLTLILNKSTVVLSANDFDITAEATKKLDAKLPTVTLAKPK